MLLLSLSLESPASAAEGVPSLAADLEARGKLPPHLSGPGPEGYPGNPQLPRGPTNEQTLSLGPDFSPVLIDDGARMASGKRPKAPLPRQIGRYQVLCALGEGGMGSVCLARVLGPGGFERLVAVKLLHEHLSRRDGFVKMFLDEARIAARIRHPNVVPVLEVGEDQGRYFIAMEYVSGETLARALNRLHKHARRIPYPLAAHLVWAASEGLHAAHELRNAAGDLLSVVHRDVSPENLIIGYDGAVRITDFGIAKANDQSSMTMPGTWKGKAGYLSPEQIASAAIDRRADIFSLGIVLWEATLGHPLFKSENPFSSAEKIRDGRVPLPHTVEEDYPPELEAVVMRALSLDPARRYQSARAFGDDLRRFLAGVPQMIGPVEVEQFMAALFADRLKKRRDLERRAVIAPSVPPAPQRVLIFGDEERTLPVEPLAPQSIDEDDPLGSIPMLTPDSAMLIASGSRSTGQGRDLLAEAPTPEPEPMPEERAESPEPFTPPAPSRSASLAGLEDDPLLSAMTSAELQREAAPNNLPFRPLSSPVEPSPTAEAQVGRGWWLVIALLVAAIGVTLVVLSGIEPAGVEAGGTTSTAAGYRRFATPDPAEGVKGAPVRGDAGKP